jgi:hypothetical protein
MINSASRLPRIFLIPAIAFSVASASADDAKPAEDFPQLSTLPDYFHDAAGTKPLRAATDMYVARMRPALGRDVSARPLALGALPDPEKLPQFVWKLERSMAQRGLHVVRNMDAQRIRAAADVTDVLPVLYHGEGDVPIYPTHRVIIRLNDINRRGELKAIADHYGCELIEKSRGTNRFVLVIRDTNEVNPVALANWLHERGDLADYAEPALFLPKVALAPDPINDPIYAQQWHLDNDVANGAAEGSDLNMEAAWDTSYGATALGSPTVRVSVLDECVEKLHPDLFPNWADGLDLDNEVPDDDPSPDAGQRHGTACAGLAVAAANNIGVRGTAPNCGLIGVKFFGATIEEMADGFYFSMDPDDNGDHSDGAAVLSNSWSFGDGTLLPADVVNAINTVATTGRDGKGVVILFASGNNDHTVNGVTALAQLSTTMAVGGTNSHNKHTEFSDVGPEVGITTPTNDRGDDGVRFPWIDITTVDNTGGSGYNGLPDLDYTNAFGGTSAATPEAAGLIALIISQDETMTAAQARAILQHTAVRIDEPYGRFDGITSHSHRFGFGQADGGQAMAAATAGIRWPDRIKQLTVTPLGSDLQLSWSTPLDDYAGSLLVRSSVPFAWTPTDGVSYTVGQFVAPGVEVIHAAPLSAYLEVGANQGGYFYGVYPYSALLRYGFGARNHRIQGSTSIFYDNSETTDPGWTTGGTGSEWTRGTPTSSSSAFLGQVVAGSGPLAGLNGTRAISGNKCWGTDLAATYNAFADAYLQTPLLNLTGITQPVYLEYYDWCMLETFYDRCTIEVVDAQGQFLGYIDDDTGGDYDWTRRAYDISAFAGQPIRIRFRLQADGAIQRDGWFIDEVRVSAATLDNLPPVVESVYAETDTNVSGFALLSGDDPNVGTTLSFVIESLPQHATLTDPFDATVIAAAPYTLKNNGFIVTFDPDTNYEGPDGFTYHASDGFLSSNTAPVSLSIGTPVVAYDFPLNSDPGWLADGQWEFGVPQGLGGDPTSGFTGSNVYGYNLAGEYENNLPPQYLTTLPMNCTGLSRVTLDFRRWLGIESASFDSAAIEVSTNGAEWSPVWNHSGTSNIEETAWSLQSFNAGAVADGEPFVQFRWAMGPTDGGDTFAGWNLDDIQVLGIGTAQANQPPFAYDQYVETPINVGVDLTLVGVDVNSDGLAFVITELPQFGTLTDPGFGVIASVPYELVGGGADVNYLPDVDSTGFDTFQFEINDGVLASNVAEVTVRVIDPAPFPFVDDFESGPPLGSDWTAESTGPGRVYVSDAFGPVGSYHVILDSGASSTFALNELTLAIDLLGASNVLLRYDWIDLGDENHSLPATWTGSEDGDGVAVSADGIEWHLIADLTDGSATYQTITLDLDQLVANAGLTYNGTFRIRFQQYDNNPADIDGLALDNISVLQGTDDPIIATASLPDGRVGDPYGPISLSVIGGDAPIVWTTPIVFTESSAGTNGFSAGGVAQNWFGDDVAFDYTLPFAFPFYGENLTDIKVAVDGWINFGPYVGSTHNNSAILLQANKRIAAMWDDQDTSVSGDVYIDDQTSGQLTVRWETLASGAPCNYAATLYSDGRIRLDYGAGNITVPTVGVSAGDLNRYYFASYDGAGDLGFADSIWLDFAKLPPGLTADANGMVSGTPTVTGSFAPLFKIEDASQRTDEQVIPITILSSLFGDSDNDGDVDYLDLQQFIVCMEDETPSGACLDSFDDDGNDRVDLYDFARFQQVFTGPI